MKTVNHNGVDHTVSRESHTITLTSVYDKKNKQCVGSSIPELYGLAGYIAIKEDSESRSATESLVRGNCISGPRTEVMSMGKKYLIYEIIN